MLQGVTCIDFGSYEVFRKENLRLNRPLVQIVCLTFGHGRFILETLEGFLIQKVAFDFEVMIFDDCSPDDTKQVVIEQLSSHSQGHRISYFRQKVNLGANVNGMFALRNITAKYVALCEGDDYWTDPNKLFMQVDFLENNPGYSICFHNTIDLTGESKEKKYESPIKSQLTFNDFLKFFWARTCSIVFRYPDEMVPESYVGAKIGDWILVLYVLQFGDARYFDNPMSVYRVHNGGLWTSSNDYKRTFDVFESLVVLKKMSKRQFIPVIDEKIAQLWISYFWAIVKTTDYKRVAMLTKSFISFSFRAKWLAVVRAVKLFSSRLGLAHVTNA